MTDRMDEESAEPTEAAEPTDELTDETQSGDEVSPGGARKRRRSPYLVWAVVAAYAAVVVTAAFASPIGFLVALLASQVVDLAAASDDYARGQLARNQLPIATRSLVRELATFALLLGAPWASDETRHLAALGVAVISVLRLVYPLVLAPLRKRRAAIPVETRNIELPGVWVPPPPPRVLVARILGRSHGLTLVALGGAALAAVLETAWLAFAAVGLVVATELVFLALVVRLRVAGRRAPRPEDLIATVKAQVSALQPEVVLYHTGAASSVYQANMWLSTIEALPRSSIVVIRDRACMRQLAPTTAPVLYIPASVDFMSFGLRDARVALYTANSAKNIHMLREQGIHHVFIGHGDSDKAASSNPFSKVYTQIWVAGPAGRERYQRAGTGINDDDIVEVGRPQLVGIDTRTGPVPAGELTVLYAPTWEGWTKDPAQANTSVIRTGPRLVQRLVSLPDVKVVYKPHPLTGKVSRAAAAADKKIRSTINQADGAHEVVRGKARTLYDCFNDADVLVADVSSVVSEFIASAKPYVVPNLTSMSDEEFREAFPSTSAGYLLDPAARQVGAVLDLIRSSDPLAEQRLALKHYLLGSDEPDALTRFISAVDTAYDEAVARCPVRPLVQLTDE